VISKQFRRASAGVGASAIIAMGGLGLVFSDTSAAEPPEPKPPGPVTTPAMSLGEKITEAPLPEAPESPAAEPPITTPPSTIPTGEPQ
jgi:hypothetical protein